MNYGISKGDLFSLSLYFNTGVLGTSTSELYVPDGDSQYLDMDCLHINVCHY